MNKWGNMLGKAGPSCIVNTSKGLIVRLHLTYSCGHVAAQRQALQPPPELADGDSTPRTMDSKSRLFAARVGGRLEALGALIGPRYVVTPSVAVI
jgi:hypothetical protein